jgi:hypothetical protein
LFKLGLRYCTSWRPKEPYSNFRSEYLETLDELYHKSHFPWLKHICDEYDFSLMDVGTQTAILLAKGVYTLDELKASNNQILDEIEQTQNIDVSKYREQNQKMSN